MTPRALVDGRDAGSVPVSDRGFKYGDGVFETVRIAGGAPVWWDAHLARLARGCARLGIMVPARDVLEDDLARLCAGKPDGVLRLTVTRGDSGRGYAAKAEVVPRRVLVLSPPPVPTSAPLRIGFAQLRLAVQPSLAGIKHLNRLEQVLAARECIDAGLDDCVLMDALGAVTCAIAANLFLVRAGRLETPLLDRCGIAGTCRAWLLDAQPEARIARLSRDDVEQADELFLCNSVRGILPVRQLRARELPVGPVTRALMRRLARAEPALASAMDPDS